MPRGSASGDQSATVAEVADWLGISSRRVRELRADGVLPGEPNDPYDLRLCVRYYCAHIRPSSGRASAGGSEGAAAFDAARIRVLTAQAIAREMLNDQMICNTVLSEDLDAVVGPVLDGVRTKTLAIPTKAAPHLLGIDSLAQMREKLTEFIYAALADIADTGAVCEAVVDRAARRAGRSGVAEAGLDALTASPEADRKPVGGRK